MILKAPHLPLIPAFQIQVTCPQGQITCAILHLLPRQPKIQLANVFPDQPILSDRVILCPLVFLLLLHPHLAQGILLLPGLLLHKALILTLPLLLFHHPLLCLLLCHMWATSQYIPLDIHLRLSLHHLLLPLSLCLALTTHRIQFLSRAVATTGTQVMVHIKQINHRASIEHQTGANTMMLIDTETTATLTDTALINMQSDVIGVGALTAQGDRKAVAEDPGMSTVELLFMVGHHHAMEAMSAAGRL